MFLWRLQIISSFSWVKKKKKIYKNSSEWEDPISYRWIPIPFLWLVHRLIFTKTKKKKISYLAILLARIKIRNNIACIFHQIVIHSILSCFVLGSVEFAFFYFISYVIGIFIFFLFVVAFAFFQHRFSHENLRSAIVSIVVIVIVASINKTSTKRKYKLFDEDEENKKKMQNIKYFILHCAHQTKPNQKKRAEQRMNRPIDEQINTLRQ